VTSAAIILIIISAATHAAWNMVSKRENPSPAFFLAATTAGCACLTPVVAPYLWLTPAITGHVWLLLIATGLCQAIYYAGLAGAYKAGHLSVAYPLARSSAVLMVAAMNLSGHHFGPASLVGMALIAAGGVVLPVERWSDWKLRDYLHASSLFALMAAAGTAGYSIVDDAALRILRSDPAMHAGRVAVTLVYALFEGLSATVWLALIVFVGRLRRPRSEKGPSYRWSSAALTGIGIYLSYSLVLLAMTYSRNVSYVVAFRQLSIPIGAVLGIAVLREPRRVMKMAGVAVMVAGLVLVALRP